MPTHYDAFISYSHSADGKLAPAVQSGLQRLGRSWRSVRALKVFRDETGLSVNPHLWSSIQEALEHSRYFVLMASPDAARSEWVNKEIECWLSDMPGERILPVLSDGELVWDSARNDFDHDASTAVPPALFGRLTEEPRYLDLRWAHHESQLNLRNGRFRDAIADLAAPMHGISKDELQSEDLRQYRRRIRLAWTAGLTVVLLTIVAVVAALFALRSASDARDQTRVARSRQLAAAATAAVGTAPDTALLLATAADRLDDSAVVRDTLLRVTEAQPAGLRRILRTPRAAGQVTSVTASANGRVVAVRTSDGLVTRFDVRSGRALRSPPPGDVPDPAVSTVSACDNPRPVVSDDGALVAECGFRRPGWSWNARTGRQVALPAEYPLSFSPDGSALAVQTAEGVRLVSTSTGRAIWSVPYNASSVAFDDRGRLVALAVESGVSSSVADVLDLSTGSRVAGPFAFPGNPGASLQLRFATGANDVVTLTALEIRRAVPTSSLVGPTAATLTKGLPNAGTRVEWSIPSGTRLEQAPMADALVGAGPVAAIAGDLAHVATLEAANSVQVRDFPSGTPVGPSLNAQVVTTGGTQIPLAFTSPDGTTLAAGTAGGLVREFEPAGALPPIARRIVGPGPGAQGMALSGSVFARSTSPLQRVSLFDAWTGTTRGGVAISQPFTALGPVVQSAISWDGSRVAVFDGTSVSVAAVRTQKVLRTIGLSSGVLSADGLSLLPRRFALSPDGSTLAIVGLLGSLEPNGSLTTVGDVTLALVDIRSGRVRIVPSTGESSTGTPDFSPDGRLVAVPYATAHQVLVYDVSSGKVAARVPRGPLAVAFLAAHKLDLAESEALVTVQLRAGAGARITAIRSTDLEQPNFLALSSDGGTLLAGRQSAPDETVFSSDASPQAPRLYDVATGSQIGDPLPGPIPVTVALRRPDEISGTTFDGALLRWDLRTDSLLRVACRLVGARVFSAAEQASYLGGFRRIRTRPAAPTDAGGPARNGANRKTLSSYDVPEGRVVTVTVLFTDLVGSTAQRTALGDDVADELVDVHDRLLRDAVAAHRGSVVKSTGDGIMAVFDAASDAVAAAVAILHAAELHNRANESAEHLVLRVGLSAGDVQFMAHDCHGTPVVEAARLEAAAAPGQILANESVRALVGTRGGHRFAPVGTLELKGLPAPIAAHEVVYEPPEDGALQIPSSAERERTPRAARVHVPLPIRLESRAAFVGRRGERETLDTALAAADAEGFRRVVLVSGEPGIGKTSLAADFARDAHSRGALVLYGRCDEDLGISYQPWVEAIEHLARHAPDLLPTAEVSARGGELRRLLPEITHDVPIPALQQSEPDADRYLLYGAVIDLFARISAQTPVVLVLDDLHWADRPSLLLLKHFVAAEAPMRIVVVATYRDSDIGPDHVLSDVIVSLYRQLGVERAVLSGLDADALGALLEERAGHDLGVEGVALRDALLQETDGNPFFVTETLRDLAETGRIRRGDDGRWTTTGDLSAIGLPTTVREVIEHRVARMGAEVQRLLHLGAVIGRDFDLDLLTRVAETHEDSVLDALEAATAAALIRPVAGPGDAFSFSHALIEYTLYEQMSPARRRRAHRRVAEALEALLGSEPGERTGELANHWLAAEPIGPEALRYSAEAGERALAALAPQEAVRWFEAALAALDGRRDDDGRARCRVLVALGDAQRHAGDARSRASLLAGAALARGLGEDRQLVRAALSNTRGWASSAGSVDHERVAVLEDALEVVGPEPTAERARLLATLSVEVSYDEDWQRRLALTDEALVIARAVGDDDTLSYVLARRHNAIQIPDQLEERLANTAENVAVTERLANPIAQFWAAHYRMLDVLMAGRIEEVDAHLATVEHLAETCGLPVMRYEAAIQRAWRELLAGRIEAAERYARSGYELGTDSSQPDATAVFAGQLFLVRFDQGRLDEIEELVSAAADQFPEIAGLRGLVALARCETGKPDQARAMLREVAGDGFASIPYDQLWLVTLTQWAMVAEHLREPDAAAAVAERLEPWHGQVAFTGAHVFGSVALPLALCESATKRYDLAEEHFGEALAAHERLGAPVWSARTQLGWARMLRSRSGPGDTERARDLASAARTTVQELGCAAIERQASAMTDPGDG